GRADRPQPRRVLPPLPRRLDLPRLHPPVERTMTFLAILALLQIEARDRCVLLTAETRTTPTQIELKWPADPKAASYSVFRKTPTAASWGDERAAVDAKENRYVDSDVQIGVAYEYKVVKTAKAGDKEFRGTGYLLAGIEVPLVDQRGKVVLVVDASQA